MGLYEPCSIGTHESDRTAASHGCRWDTESKKDIPYFLSRTALLFRKYGIFQRDAAFQIAQTQRLHVGMQIIPPIRSRSAISQQLHTRLPIIPVYSELVVVGVIDGRRFGLSAFWFRGLRFRAGDHGRCRRRGREEIAWHGILCGCSGVMMLEMMEIIRTWHGERP